MHLTLSGSSLLQLPQEGRFALAATAGFDGIELVVTPELWRRGARYASMLAEKYELPVLTLHPPMQRMLRWERDDWYVNSMQMAIQIPTCRVIVFHTPNTISWEGSRGRWYREAIRRCRAMSERVRIALETPNADMRSIEGGSVERPLLYNYDELLRFAEAEDVQITFDTCHASTTQAGMLDSYELLRQRITNVHFSDIRDQARIPQFVTRLNRVRRFLLRHYTPGAGVLPLEAFVHRLIGNGYTHTLTFEETPLAMPFWSTRATLAHLKKVLEHWRAVIAAANTLRTRTKE